MSTDWKNDPRLTKRFHPDYPGDIQVVVHDGGPRFSDKGVEVVWVTVLKQVGDGWSGKVLNQPSQLTHIKEGDKILFVDAGIEQLFMVTPRYMQERKKWDITPCKECGFSELFDPPSKLIEAIFPDSPKDSVTEMFTHFCPFCNDVQTVQYKGN